MDEATLDLEQELQHLHAEISRLEHQLALLEGKCDLTQNELWTLRRELRSRSRASDLNALVCRRVTVHAWEQMRPRLGVNDAHIDSLDLANSAQRQENMLELSQQLTRGLITEDEFHDGMTELSDGLLSVHYVPDTDTSDERSFTLRLPFKFLTSMHYSKRPAFELTALGSSEVVLVVPGNELLDWLENDYRWWNRGEIRFKFERRLSTGQVWLMSITQARSWGRGEQTRVCRQVPLEVTHHLNRYDLLTVEED